MGRKRSHFRQGEATAGRRKRVGSLIVGDRSDRSLFDLAAGIVAIRACICAGVYRLNQDAVRTELVPRRQEFVELLTSLKDEPPGVSPPK
jgi:hypothetical protein